MLHFLNCRCAGLHEAYSLPIAERTRRTFSIKLSQHGNVDQVHKSGVNSVDIDPIEGRYLLSSSSHAKIAIHDIENCSYKKRFHSKTIMEADRTFPGNHRQSVETVQWYPHDTGMFLSSSADKTIRVWDTNAFEVVETFKFNGIVYNHQMSKIAQKHCLIATGTEDSRVYLCDLKSGSASHILRGHSRSVLSVAWSPRNEYLLVSGSRDNKVLLWDIRKAVGSLLSLDQHNGKSSSRTSAIRTAHNGHINGMCFTFDGLHLLTYGTDDRLRLWDVFSGQNTLVNYGQVSNPCRKAVQMCVSCEAQHEVAFVPTESNISMFEVHSGRAVTDLVGHYNTVNCCTFLQDYQGLFSGGNDCNILTWLPDMQRQEEVADVEAKKTQKNEKVYQDSWSSDED